MEIFSQEMRYRRGDLLAVIDSWSKPRLCLSSTRHFFDLPTKRELRASQVDHMPQFVVSVHDRKKKHGVAIRIAPFSAKRTNMGWGNYDERKVQVERTDAEGHIGWSNIGFYDETSKAMLSLFDESGKETLYVTIEAI